MSRKILVVGFALGSLALALPSIAQDTSGTATGSGAATTGTGTAVQMIDTATFLTMAASSNMLEIESSKLAEGRADAAVVRQFADQMIADHTAATQRMMSVVAAAGLPAPPQMLQPRHQEMLETLEDQSGTSFDAAYVQMQAMAHQEAIGLFGSYAQSGENESLRAFAAETLPTLQAHAEMIGSLPGSAVDATGDIGTPATTQDEMKTPGAGTTSPGQ